MIKLEMENKHLIIFIQAYATCIQGANGDLSAASRNMDMFKYIRSKFTQKDMISLHTFIEKTNKENKVQLNMTMADMGLKSEQEPLIKIVTH